MAQKQIYVPNTITFNEDLTYNQAESDNFVLFYGDLMSDTFSENAILDILEASYSYFADSLNYRTTDINAIDYKFPVIVDESWSISPSPNTATPNSVKNFDGIVDGIWLDTNTAENVNDVLKAHEVAHLFQRIVPLVVLPIGEPYAYQAMEETHAQYLAYKTYSDLNPDYIGRQLRNRESWLRKNEYFRFYFLFYIQEAIGTMGVNGLYNNLYYKEHPFKGYGRIFNRSIENINQSFTQYTMRVVNMDFEQRSNWLAPLNIYDRDGITDAVYDESTGWYTVEASSSINSIAPEAYGFNVHEIETYKSSTVNLTFESIKEDDPMAGNTLGFVAIKNDTARYSQVFTEIDTDISFDLESEERLFLVVVGSPKEYVYIDENDMYNQIYDYPYRYQVNYAADCPTFLESCDDESDCTENDVFDGNCECLGTINSDVSVSIPFVSINVNNAGWNTYNDVPISVHEGDDIGFIWAGTSPNETWYAPDGTVLSTDLIFYLNNIAEDEGGTYVLTVFDSNNCISETIEIDIELTCSEIGNNCDDGDSSTENDIINDDCICIGASIGAILSFKVLFEGFIKADGTMLNSLNASGLIPTTQPFDTEPWNYRGTENQNPIPTDAIDWVLIKLYDVNGNVLESQAALAYDTGEVYGLNTGTNSVQFITLQEAIGFISIHQKSHLAVIADFIDLQSATVDFTSNIALGVNQTKNYHDYEVMIAGDFDANGIINNLDYNIWGTNSSAINGYFLHDADGNAIINNADFNLWAINKSKVGQPLIQY